ncbi:hypothetical protein M3Y94_00605200 [Aphelenchoides besseyi]|nr:hypothetical protein M3Y94_00605200 [Aphelenchoides besseyi]
MSSLVGYEMPLGLRVFAFLIFISRVSADTLLDDMNNKCAKSYIGPALFVTPLVIVMIFSLVFLILIIVVLFKTFNTMRKQKKEVESLIFQLMDDVLRGGIPPAVLNEMYEVARLSMATKAPGKAMVKRGRTVKK